MKKTIFFGLGALLALGVTSCSKDEIGLNMSEPLKSDQTFYTNISVMSTDAQTRAYESGDYDNTTDPEFDAGETYENSVRSIYFIFYDEDHQRVATAQVMRNNAAQAAGGDNNYDFETPGTAFPTNENSVYEGIVQVDVKQGMKRPSYVMCFVNPITKTNFEINPDFATLETLERATRDQIIDADNYFAMSKSVYYGDDPVSGNANWKIIATPIKCVTKEDGSIDKEAVGNQLFTSADDAKKALEGNGPNRDGNSSVVDIYVERYAAKVGFDVSSATINEIKSKEGLGTSHTLKFEPEYWAVNAYENKTYATKSFLSVDMSSDLDYDYLNESLGWFWNSPKNHRSYWAQSPAYYASRYPRNADDILDKMEDEPMGALDENKNPYEDTYYALGYYSYDYIKAAATHKLADKARKVSGADKDEKYPYIYVRENTVQGQALRDAAKDPMASAKAAIGSVVLCGRYTLDGKPVDDNTTIYVMGNATNGYQIFANQNEMKDYFVNSAISMGMDKDGKPFFNYSNTEYGFMDDHKAYADLFDIVHPSEGVRKNFDVEDGKDPEELLVLDSRFVTLQIKKDKLSDSTPLYVYLDGKYEKVTASNVDKVNRQILYSCGTVQGYKGGLAYYSIPIKHLGFYRTGNKNAGLNPGDKDFDWQSVRTGDFGLVRNHFYNLKVTEISGLGNGIPDPNEPIVPPTDPEEYYIGARLIILNWAVVPQQEVKL